jgi:hypothetical protein
MRQVHNLVLYAIAVSFTNVRKIGVHVEYMYMYSGYQTESVSILSSRRARFRMRVIGKRRYCCASELLARKAESCHYVPLDTVSYWVYQSSVSRLGLIDSQRRVVVTQDQCQFKSFVSLVYSC